MSNKTSKAKQEFFSVDETVVKLGIKAKAVRRLLRAGTLKGKKVLGEWQVIPDSIQAYLNPPKALKPPTTGNVSKDTKSAAKAKAHKAQIEKKS